MFMVLGGVLLFSSVSVQASTIVLQDGRTITGDIVKQDKDEVIVNNGDSPVTYYKDEIVSIDGNPVAVKDIAAPADPEKEKLVEQFLELMPTDEFIQDWVELRFPLAKRQAVLEMLKRDQSYQAVTEIRTQGYMKYYSIDTLKAMIDFYSSPEGKESLEALRKFNLHAMPQVVIMMEREAARIKRSIQ